MTDDLMREVHDAVTGHADRPTCKIEGCVNEAAQMMGPYAKLCSTHRSAAMAQKQQLAGAVKEARAQTEQKQNGHRVEAMNIVELAHLIEERKIEVRVAEDKLTEAIIAMRLLLSD